MLNLGINCLSGGDWLGGRNRQSVNLKEIARFFADHRSY
jgi:hypothetical protein